MSSGASENPRSDQPRLENTAVAGGSRSHWGRVALWGALAVVVLGAAGYGWWRWKQRGPNMLAAFQVNNRGVGFMEQFAFPEATGAFEEVVALAPDWLPGKINLGIALLNIDKPQPLARARKIFSDVLEDDPDNLHAHFCLGIILYHQGKPEDRAQATEHFRFVTRRDPSDPAAWYWLGHSLLARRQAQDNPKEAADCFRRAIRLDPNLGAAYHALRPLVFASDPKEAKAAFEEANALRIPGDEKATRGNPIYLAYGEMGRYAAVIGRGSDLQARRPTGPLPRFEPVKDFQVRLAPGTRWARGADFGRDEVGRLRARARDRFGAVMVVLDYNHDGKPDLFLVGAVVRQGKVRDLLLRNDGEGRFTDVTAEAGLGDARPSLGCCVADYDNDGLPDLLITGAGEQHLFRNTGRGRFEDVSAKAALDEVKTICLGAAFVDLDQDGDLDLILAQYAPLEQAGRVFAGKGLPTGGGLAVFVNTGEALPGPETRSRPLTTRFHGVRLAGDRLVKHPVRLLGRQAPVVNVALSDLDQDNDIDFLVLADDRRAPVVLNDRLLRFHRTRLPEAVVPRARWNGGLVLDVNRDTRSDLLLVGPGRRPVLLVNQPGGDRRRPAKWFKDGPVNSPPLLQAQAIDVDLDGWTDVVGLSDKHVPVLLHNTGGRLAHVGEALGAEAGWPADLVGLAVGDFNGDGYPDLMVWSESRGLRLHASKGNGHHALRVTLFGERRNQPEYNADRKVRTNADGFGAKVSAYAKDLWTGVENTTLSAGLGQSHQPLFLGLGTYVEADVVRVTWTDNTFQAELNTPTSEVLRVREIQRRSGSCPLVFTWDGERYVFVTDFLGAGSLGESLAEGGYRTPRPEESVKIEAHQLKPHSGEYIIQIAEPMDEITYLDRLQLVALEHPADVVVYPDERFTDAASPPSQRLLTFRKGERIFPEKARDHRGRDVTRTLRKWDRDTVRKFAQRSWTGFAEEHWVELDFGERLAKLGPGRRVFLCLAGWTNYPYPESIWAARQAGVTVQPPVLERLREGGCSSQWEPVVTADGKPVEAGFPAGLPRMMTLEVTSVVGKLSRQPLAQGRCVLRLRTNMEIYWDQAFLAPLQETGRTGKRQSQVASRELEVRHADLSARGLMQEFSPDGREPTLYDFDRVDRVPVSRLSGRMTRYGPVTELLQERDDCFVIFGPGDVLRVRFDARSLPPLPRGWVRSFVLRTWGYCKDCAPFTATGDTVEPLPFRAMSTYPYDPREQYPSDPKHNRYRQRYNTRQVGPKPIISDTRR
jgi:hypothetical protein